MEKKRILIIDDSPNDIQIVMENLKDEYAILVATNGLKGVELASAENKPDVILMDVEMPEMDGYEACRKIKEIPQTQDIDVIFVSAHDSTEEKLAGYDAGASDYVIKPVDPAELLRKVKLAIKYREIRESTTGEKDLAFNTAMIAMTSAGEQGIVLEFLCQSFMANSIHDLAKLSVEAIAKYDLQSTVQFRAEEGIYNFGSNNPVSPLEQDLLLRLKDSDRILEYAQRAIFNFGNVSLLIKNMPEDDDLRGRLRDHLAILAEGMKTRLTSLDMQGQLSSLVKDANQALQQIDLEQTQHKKMSQAIMDKILHDLEASFLSWGLSEEQEDVLLALVQQGLDSSLDHMEQGINIDNKMREIINRLVAI